MAEKIDWVEIVEPRSKELMYANLKTGQCMWEAPPGVKVRHTDDSQWWELYDQKTRRYYYYNVASKSTVWHKPKDCEIIPLAKLQCPRSGTYVSEPDNQSANFVCSTSMKAREKRRSSRSREDRKDGYSRRDGERRREGSGRRHHREVGAERGDGEERHVRSVSSDRRDGPGGSREGYSSRRKGSGGRRERISSREHRKRSAQDGLLSESKATHEEKVNGLEEEFKVHEDVNDEGIADVQTTPRENNHLDTSSQTGDTVDDSVLENHLVPVIQEQDEEQDVVESGRITPSGTLTKNETSDYSLSPTPASPCKSDASPSGTMKQRKNKPTAPWESVPNETNKNSRESQLDEEVAEVFEEANKPITNDQRQDSAESLSMKLQAGGMPVTTALLVEACSPPPEVPKAKPALHRLRHQRQKSDSVVHLSHHNNLNMNLELDLDRDDTVSEGSATLPRTSRPSSVCQTQGRTGHNTLERSHSVPTAKQPFFRELSAYERFLNQHTKGIFRKKRVSIATMLSWSKVPIRKPIIMMQDRQLKRDAVDIFKMTLAYMGDRSIRGRTQERLALDITTKGWSTPVLRDEIYIQLCKQTTDNTRADSLRKGWELMSVCLALFPPSTKFHSYLEGYISRHLGEPDKRGVPVSKYAAHCYKKLEKISRTGAKRGLRKPSFDEIEQAKNSVFNPSMFGASLVDIMQMQQEKYPDLRLPWILTTLAETVLEHKGAQTEGIFRVPGDIDDVNAQKVRLDRWEEPEGICDPHVPGSLLKLWFRELHVPLIPPDFYEKCVANCDDPTVSVALIFTLPEINRLVLSYLIRFLQIFSLPDVSTTTKMDVNNLSMVWAPNCLRCPSDNPQVIFENTRREMTFIRTLLWNLDTSYMEGVK